MSMATIDCPMASFDCLLLSLLRHLVASMAVVDVAADDLARTKSCSLSAFVVVE